MGVLNWFWNGILIPENSNQLLSFLFNWARLGECKLSDIINGIQ